MTHAAAPRRGTPQIKKKPPLPRRAPHCGAWYESPRPRHGGFAADETCGRAAPRHAVNKNNLPSAGACTYYELLNFNMYHLVHAHCTQGTKI
jgi:hypothetical protein